MRYNKNTTLKTFAMGAVLGFTSLAIQAKEIVYYEPHTGYKEYFDSENAPDRFKSKEPHTVIRAGNITWNITYQDVIDNSNFGFDDPTFGASRRAVVDAVVNYVNNVLNTSPGAPPTIDVHWNTSINDPGGSTLASMGTLFFLGPNGFNNGFAFDHITTGVDPSGGNIDISGQVNFGRTWNSELDATAGGEFDLATVILHEITHGLGFLSLSESDGTSGISSGNPGVFSVQNDLMALGAGGTDLFTAGGVFAGSSANLISDNVFFTGSNANTANANADVKLYAPGTFSSGSSLSHLDTATFSASGQVMVHAIGTGVDNRAYGVIDLGVLQDIGYTNAAPDGQVPVELMNFEVE